jgi:periplasmic protein TonB
MKRFGPAFVISVLLHVGLFLLAFVWWRPTANLLIASSVPVEIVSSVPAQQMAQTEVDPKAVKPPSPEPETPIPPQPEPKPEPKPLPPTPAKPEVKPVVAPSRDGLKKPVPDKPKKPDLLDSILNAPTVASSKAKTRNPAAPAPRPTNGASNQGTAPQDAGPESSAIKAAIQRNWAPCSVTGAKDVSVVIGFTISTSGLIIKGPEWLEPRNDPQYQQAASLAKLSVKKGEPYTDLPPESYNRPWEFVFNPKTFCRNQ